MQLPTNTDVYTLLFQCVIVDEDWNSLYVLLVRDFIIISDEVIAQTLHCEALVLISYSVDDANH